MSIISIDHIIDNLYASSNEIAEDLNILQKYNIEIIISLNNNKHFKSLFEYYIYDIKDDPEYKIEVYFNEIFNIISLNKKTLIHCDAGVSRTGIFVIYYLMYKLNYNYDEALKYAKSKRNCINPNSGFELKLRLLNNNDKIKLNNINFIIYDKLCFYISDYIIGLGSGMNYGNKQYNIKLNIDDILLNINDIITEIKLHENIIIYGYSKIIDIVKYIYYKKNSIFQEDIKNLTNEEHDKINNYLNNKYVININIQNIDIDTLYLKTKSQLYNLLTKIDNNDIKVLNKKEIVKKINYLLDYNYCIKRV